MKNIINLFKLKKQNQGIKGKIIKDIRFLFEQEDGYHKLKIVSNFWNINYIEQESNGGRNKNSSLKQYLGKIKFYLKDIVVDLQESDTWKIQLLQKMFMKNLCRMIM